MSNVKSALDEKIALQEGRNAKRERVKKGLMNEKTEKILDMLIETAKNEEAKKFFVATKELWKKHPEVFSKSEKEIEVVKEWVNYAKEDLESSVVLYKEKNFRNSLFMLEQAVEKTVKAVDIYAFGIKQKEMRNINHYTPEGCIKAVEKIVEFGESIESEMPELSPHIQILKKHLIELEKSLSSFYRKNKRGGYSKNEKNLKSILFMNSDEIRNILAVSNKITEDGRNKGYLEWKHNAEMVKKVLEDMGIDGNNIPQASREFFIKSYEIYFIPMRLTYLSLFTFPYAFLRYPDDDLKISQNTENGIIQAFPELVKELEDIFSVLEKTLEF